MRVVAAVTAAMLFVGSALPATAQPAVAPAPPPPPPGKSPGTAVGLAVAGSIVPAIGFGVGLSIDDAEVGSRVVIFSTVGGLVLPSLGHIYARRKRTLGMYPRVAALGTLLLGALLDGLGNSDDAGSWYGLTGGLYVLGCGIDIATAPAAVRAYNAERAGVTVGLTPTVVPGGAGLALGGTF